MLILYNMRILFKAREGKVFTLVSFYVFKWIVRNLSQGKTINKGIDC